MELSRYLHLGAAGPLRVAVWTADRFVTHEMTTYAAALAYRSLLALFPFAIFVIAVVNSLDVWRLFDMLLDWARTAPEGRVPNAIREWAVVQSRERAHGAVLSVGALAALWAVASGARVLRRALNIAGDIPEVHPAWLRLLTSFVAAPMLGTALVAILGLFTVTRSFLWQVAAWFDLNRTVIAVWDWIRVPIGLLLATVVITALFQYGPSRRQPLRGLVPGAVVAAVVWTAASLIFSRAVSSVLEFGVTYGSFSTAIVLLLYLYFAAAGLLVGAELNAVLKAGQGAASGTLSD